MSTQEITLDKPIERGTSQITKLTLHKPNSGALRGVSIRSVLDMDVDTIITVIPRISEPKLTDDEAKKIDLPDLMQAGVALAGFFMPKAALAVAAAEVTSSSLTT